MNLVLLETTELDAPLPRTDPRALHILNVLRRIEGDTFDVGLVNGQLGKATLAAVSTTTITLNISWGSPPIALPSTTLIIGLPRPQTARDILRDATTLGATCIHFVATERTDPNYAASTLWTTGEWRRHCLTGAAQALDTRIPDVTWTHTLSSAITAVPTSASRFALDNYEATTALREKIPHETVLAFGPERGWGPTDREALRTNGFTLTHLGQRVLRVETAVVSALAIVRLGSYQ